MKLYGVLKIKNNIPSIEELLEEDELEQFANSREVVELEEMSENGKKVYNFKFNNFNYQLIREQDGMDIILRA
jgi:hypothetical protein